MNTNKTVNLPATHTAGASNKLMLIGCAWLLYAQLVSQQALAQALLSAEPAELKSVETVVDQITDLNEDALASLSQDSLEAISPAYGDESLLARVAEMNAITQPVAEASTAVDTTAAEHSLPTTSEASASSFYSNPLFIVAGAVIAGGGAVWAITGSTGSHSEVVATQSLSNEAIDEQLKALAIKAAPDTFASKHSSSKATVPDNVDTPSKPSLDDSGDVGLEETPQDAQAYNDNDPIMAAIHDKDQDTEDLSLMSLDFKPFSLMPDVIIELEDVSKELVAMKETMPAANADLLVKPPVEGELTNPIVSVTEFTSLIDTDVDTAFF